MADPASVSVVIPALDEGDVIGDVVASLRAAAPWREILVVDRVTSGKEFLCGSTVAFPELAVRSADIDQGGCL